MIRNHYRITKSSDFDLLRLNSKRYIYKNIFILYFRANGLEHSRIALSVPKKKINAIQRNKIRRVVRESFFKNLTIDPGLDILVCVKPLDFLNQCENWDLSLSMWQSFWKFVIK